MSTLSAPDMRSTQCTATAEAALDKAGYPATAAA